MPERLASHSTCHNNITLPYLQIGRNRRMWKGHYEIENKANETGVLRHGNKPTTSVCSGQPALHSGELWSVEKECGEEPGVSPKRGGRFRWGILQLALFPPFLFC